MSNFRVGERVIFPQFPGQGVIHEIQPNYILVDISEQNIDQKTVIVPIDLCKHPSKKIPLDGGTKHDQEKIRVELISAYALEELGKVLTFGSQKYDAHNWRKGISFMRVLGALFRHYLRYLMGETYDKESKLSHMAHIMCCSMFLLEQEKTRPDLDDRYVTVKD